MPDPHFGNVPAYFKEIASGDTPSAGQISLYAKTDGKMYYKDDAGVETEVGGGGGSITTSDTPPVSPSAGDLWFNSENGSLYVYYDDGNSQQWVSADGTLAVPAVGGGAMILLASATASNSADITFDNEFDSSLYSEYVLKFQGVQPATDNVTFRVQLRNSTPSDITDFHRNNHFFGRIDAIGSGNAINQGGTTGWVMAGNDGGNAANELSSGNLYIQPISGQWTHVSGLIYYTNSTLQRYSITIAGACEGTTAPAGVKIYFSSGNISIGTFQLYGITK